MDGTYWWVESAPAGVIARVAGIGRADPEAIGAAGSARGGTRFSICESLINVPLRRYAQDAAALRAGAAPGARSFEGEPAEPIDRRIAGAVVPAVVRSASAPSHDDRTCPWRSSLWVTGAWRERTDTDLSHSLARFVSAVKTGST
jgi:hypothetical protein